MLHMSIPAWFALALAIPVLLLGEVLVRRVPWLARFNIPAPVAGGLLVALLALIGNVSGGFAAKFETSVTAQWWTWLVTIVTVLFSSRTVPPLAICQ